MYHLEQSYFDKHDYLRAKVDSDPEFREIKDRAEARVRAINAGKADLDPKKMKDDIKSAVFHDLMYHPRFRIEYGNARWEKQGIPNAPTLTRLMTEKEQVFLTNAHNRIAEDMRNHPYHAHGESGVVGDKAGNITEFNHEAGHSLTLKNLRGNKYNLHTHPPFNEPFTSSASGLDHFQASRLFEKYDMLTYVSNGKDIINISPVNMGIQKLIPDPEVEKKLGKFPAAFEMPEPKTPPYPFQNHET
ncbi:MAG TPA: hypothetical protein VK465_05775 [Fibrobacteria bacterium]|nr:hypothetical protein [Fibrobacteria bacterium]